MGYLAGVKAYLSWPIEQAAPNDRGREAPKIILQTEFKVNVFDPFDDPKQKWVPVLQEAKLKEDYEKVSEIAHRFVNKDLTLVSRSDFLIANLPKGVPTVGVPHEIINSNADKKATLLVCPQGKREIPSWYYGFIPLRYMFGSWESLYQYLREVDAGKHMDDDRWAYVYGLI